MSGEMVSIKDLNKVAVFAALYNRARPQGMGFMHYDPTPLTVETAKQVFALRSDYVKGRVMKIDISGDEIDPRLYDRDNGPGAAAEAIAELCDSNAVNGPVTQAKHHLGRQTAAQDVYEHFHEDTGLGVAANGMPVMRLGLSDVADVLLPRVRAATSDTVVDDLGQ